MYALRKFTGVLMIVLLLSGCSLVLPGTVGGRSAHIQILESRTYEEALKKIAWPSTMTDKKLYVQASGVTEDTVSSSFLAMGIRRSLLDKGLKPEFVADRGKSDFILEVWVDTMGTDTLYSTTGSDLIGGLLRGLVLEVAGIAMHYDFYYSARCHLRARLYTPDYSYMEDFEGDGYNEFTQYRFFLGIIGPFRGGTIYVE